MREIRTLEGAKTEHTERNEACYHVTAPTTPTSLNGSGNGAGPYIHEPYHSGSGSGGWGVAAHIEGNRVNGMGQMRRERDTEVV